MIVYSKLDYLPYLELRFSDVTRTKQGFLFGSSPKCDIHLPYNRVSKCHFSLTFNEDKRLIIEDRNSFEGTEVTYDNEGKGVRREFRWIVGGHEVLMKTECITVTIPNAISFQLVVPAHNTESAEYIAGVERFCQRTPATNACLKELGLLPKSRSTEAPELDTTAIHLEEVIGRGSYGVVSRLWNVSDGSIHALKTPDHKRWGAGWTDHKAWEEEAIIMGQVSHAHIVKLIGSSFDEYPELRLEYIPLGTLDSLEAVSYNEIVTIVQQCLSALTYLHEFDTPIAHRDIKPSNILVQSRSEGSIHIKLGDFGLSRKKSRFTTICGTFGYLAPEVMSQRGASNHKRTKYDEAVDIWSLGVVACQLMYGFPIYDHSKHWAGIAWCERIVEWLKSNLQRQPNELGTFLERAMVVLSPESRFSARECYNWVFGLPKIKEVNFYPLPPVPRSVDEYATLTEQPSPSADAGTIALPTATSSLVFPPSSSSKTAQMGDKVSETPSPVAVEHHANEQANYEWKEYQRFSSDLLHPWYVGSTLASELGRKGSDTEASQSSQSSGQKEDY